MMTVNPDCPGTDVTTVPAVPGMEVQGRIVYFDEGKEAFIVPLERAGPGPGPATPIPFGVCQATRIDR